MLDARKIMMAGLLSQNISKTAQGVQGMLYLLIIKSDPKKNNQWTSNKATNAKVTIICRGNEYQPIWSEKVNPGYDRKVLEHTVRLNSLCLWMCNCRPVRVPMLSPSTIKSANIENVCIRTRLDGGRRSPGLMNGIFLYRMDGLVYVLHNWGTHRTWIHYGKKPM